MSGVSVLCMARPVRSHVSLWRFLPVNQRITYLMMSQHIHGDKSESRVEDLRSLSFGLVNEVQNQTHFCLTFPDQQKWRSMGRILLKWCRACWVWLSEDTNWSELAEVFSYVLHVNVFRFVVTVTRRCYELCLVRIRSSGFIRGKTNTRVT